MIASFYRHGRLGNRLFTFANLVAFSETHGVPLMMSFFSRYRRMFPYFDADRWCRYPSETRAPSIGSRPAFLRVASFLGTVPTVRFWQPGSVFFDEEDAGDPRLATMIHSPIVVFEGWDFRSRRAILRFREKIVSVFRPRPAIEQEVQKRMSMVRGNGDVVVGVHVRWEDYRGTDRFLELPEYASRIRELRALLSPRKAAFLVVSPEQVPAVSLPETSFVFSGQSAVVDMYSLAQCEYVMGPPSTFSMWASFYGGHPLFLLKSGRRIEDLSPGRMATP
jgi:hypothetical protein